MEVKPMKILFPPAARPVRLLLPLLLIAVAAPAVWAERSVGLIQGEPSASAGYTLFSPLASNDTCLIDNAGRLVHTWPGGYPPGNSVYLLEDGVLLRTGTVGNPVFTSGGAGGNLRLIDWDGTVLWDYTYSNTAHLQHHDVEMLPDGNILMIAWQYKSGAEAIAAGRDPALIDTGKLWPDSVIEVDPDTDTIVWEWHLWDHLVQEYDPGKNNYGSVADNPQLVDLNYVARPPSGPADWTHINSIDYHPGFDQILLSVHEFNEIWVIDHSTTTAEAASHSGGNSGRGGDLLYRWGNPRTYRAGDLSDQKFFGQHDARWIESGYPGEGNILVFNNGAGNTRDYSSVEEITPPVDGSGNYSLAPGSAYGPAAQSWIYTADPREDFYSGHISGAHRLEDGHTLICEGETGRFFEIDGDERIIWQYVNPVDNSGPRRQGSDTLDNNQVFRCRRYPPDYPGFTGKDLTPSGPIELPEPRSFIQGGDYDGDGTSDIAIFRPGSGLWAVRGLTRVYFGTDGDIPVSGDYRGDGTDRIGVFRPASGLWAVRGLTRRYFGRADDTPVPADYDGDGTGEAAVFRDCSGLWAVSGLTRFYFGSAGDSPLSGDFNGDSTAAAAVFREDSGLWAVRGVTRVYFGTESDLPVPADYGGSGSDLPAVFRPASGLWALRGLTRAYFGREGDWAVPAAYAGGPARSPGVFREDSGLWAVRGVTRLYFGTAGDQPAAR